MRAKRNFGDNCECTVTIYGHNTAVIRACHVYIENLCERVYDVLFQDNTGALCDMLIRAFCIWFGWNGRIRIFEFSRCIEGFDKIGIVKSNTSLWFATQTNTVCEINGMCVIVLLCHIRILFEVNVFKNWSTLRLNWRSSRHTRVYTNCECVVRV